MTPTDHLFKFLFPARYAELESTKESNKISLDLANKSSVRASLLDMELISTQGRFEMLTKVSDSYMAHSNRLHKDLQAANRRIAALKGVITKLKNGKK